ncbi:MAG: hypothetical protein ACFFDS_03935 [Candidatus Thorarchaeota archaeon]
MKELEKEDLLKSLKENSETLTQIDMDAVDFVLLKLNELRYEVSLKLQERENKKVKKSVS